MSETKILIQDAELAGEWDDEDFVHIGTILRQGGRIIQTAETALCGFPLSGRTPREWGDALEKPICPICLALHDPSKAKGDA